MRGGALKGVAAPVYHHGMSQRTLAIFLAALCLDAVLAAEPSAALEELPFEAERARQTLSIAARHQFLRRLDWPQPEITVMLPCLVNRQSGQVMDCDGVPQDGVTLLQRNTAEQLARGLVFDLGPLDRTDPRALRVHVPVRMAQADLRPLEFQGPGLRPQDLPYVARPTSADFNLAFPALALREGVGAQVDLLCQVQADGSLVCREPQVRQTDSQLTHYAEFRRAADRLVLRYRVAAQLRDGAPSEGAVVGLSIQFMVAE